MIKEKYICDIIDMKKDYIVKVYNIMEKKNNGKIFIIYNIIDKVYYKKIYEKIQMSDRR